MYMMIIETDRLYLREMTKDDFDDLKKVLSDPDSMKFYPRPFTDEKVNQWIKWNIENYDQYGHGLWAVILKVNDVFIGDCGITMQNIDGDTVPEIGFHIIKDYCCHGYATEAALACVDYALNKMEYSKVYSYSRIENIPSQIVAKKIGMTLHKKFVKNSIQQIAYIIVNRLPNKLQEGTDEN